MFLFFQSFNLKTLKLQKKIISFISSDNNNDYYHYCNYDNDHNTDYNNDICIITSFIKTKESEANTN